jgi:hypothetical protein
LNVRRKLLFVLSILLLSACAPSGPDVNATATQDALNNGATQTAAALTTPTPTTTVPPLPIPSESETPTAAQPSQEEMQFLAYIKDGHLLVTDVTNGVQGGTTQYTMAGESPQVSDLVWSPSGEFVAFVASVGIEEHIFFVFAVGAGSPVDLGPGSLPAWSPDSQSVAYVGGAFPNNNIWVTTIDNPAPRQLTFETNFAWGRPAFTPDGGSLVVAGADRNNMGAQGNTSFLLDSLALDGSGTRLPLPGATPLEGVRLPYDLQFSPDGTKLAFSTSFHLSACASPGAYYVSNPDGSNRQELVSPSLQAAIDPNQEHYHVGLSYAWSPASDGIVALGNVIDCNLNSPTPGQVIAGPQMSTIGLDGSEGLVIPGFLYGISMDRTGTMIAAAHFLEGFQDLNPNVEIYSAQTGQPILSLGPGSNPQFQP